jgi:endoglucanase
MGEGVRVGLWVVRKGTLTAAVISAGLVLLAAILLAAILVGKLGHPVLAPRPMQARVPVDTSFYVDPNDYSNEWVRSNPGDPRAAVIANKIVPQPKAKWFTSYNPDGIAQDVGTFVSAAAQRGQIPVLVAYAIPHRDCGGLSSGGAPDVISYRRWVDNFAGGLGAAPAWVVLEPDSLAEAGCLTQLQRKERFEAVAYAAGTLRRSDPNVRLYYDSGHSGWQRVSTMVQRLRASGAPTYANGVALNVSNFRRTGGEVSYGLAVLRALGDRSLGMVIDTSRNGNGPSDGRICDPPGRMLGTRPTARTGNPWVDAFLWIKPPGESDGCLAGAGTFVSEYAYQLATASPRVT